MGLMCMYVCLICFVFCHKIHHMHSSQTCVHVCVLLLLLLLLMCFKIKTCMCIIIIICQTESVLALILFCSVLFLYDNKITSKFPELTDVHWCLRAFLSPYYTRLQSLTNVLRFAGKGPLSLCLFVHTHTYIHTHTHFTHTRTHTFHTHTHTHISHTHAHTHMHAYTHAHTSIHIHTHTNTHTHTHETSHNILFKWVCFAVSLLLTMCLYFHILVFRFNYNHFQV